MVELWVGEWVGPAGTGFGEDRPPPGGLGYGPQGIEYPAEGAPESRPCEVWTWIRAPTAAASCAIGVVERATSARGATVAIVTALVRAALLLVVEASARQVVGTSGRRVVDVCTLIASSATGIVSARK